MVYEMHILKCGSEYEGRLVRLTESGAIAKSTTLYRGPYRTVRLNADNEGAARNIAVIGIGTDHGRTVETPIPRPLSPHILRDLTRIQEEIDSLGLEGTYARDLPSDYGPQRWEITDATGRNPTYYLDVRSAIEGVRNLVEYRRRWSR